MDSLQHDRKEEEDKLGCKLDTFYTPGVAGAVLETLLLLDN